MDKNKKKKKIINKNKTSKFFRAQMFTMKVHY